MLLISSEQAGDEAGVRKLEFVIAAVLAWLGWGLGKQAIEDSSEKRRQDELAVAAQQVRDAAKPWIDYLVPLYDSALREAFPSIPWAPLSTEELLDLPSHCCTHSVRACVLDSMRIVRDRFLKSYEAYSWQPTSPPAEEDAVLLAAVNQESLPKKRQNTPPYDWPVRRAAVAIRDGYRCQRCGTQVVLDECHIHHIQRKSKGGGHELGNLVTMCRDCHTLMPEHEHMHAVGHWRVTSSGMVHLPHCHHGRGGRMVHGPYPGGRACKQCKPKAYVARRQDRWVPKHTIAVADGLREQLAASMH